MKDLTFFPNQLHVYTKLQGVLIFATVRTSNIAI